MNGRNCYKQRENHAPRLRRHAGTSGNGYAPENRKEAGIIPWLGVDENTVLTNRQKISANGVLQWSTIRRLTEEVMQRMTVKAASSETPSRHAFWRQSAKSGDR